MKLLNKALCLVALFAMGSMLAKVSPVGGAAKGAAAAGATGAAVGKQTPGKQVQPVAGEINYKAIRNQIFGMGQQNVMQGNLLNTDFIDKMKATGADDVELDLFLKIARDRYLPLTGNDATDLARLKAINEQIENA